MRISIVIKHKNYQTNKLKKTKIDYEPFVLPFSQVDEEDDDTDYESKDYQDQAKEKMEALIPSCAIFLGTVDSNIENWSSWRVDDDYYIMPLKDDAYDWALFRVTWDDNWMRWDWSFDCRLKGFSDNPQEAAKYMLTRVWRKWKIRRSDRGNDAYQELFYDVQRLKTRNKY